MPFAQSVDFVAIAPPLLVLLTAVAVLLADLFASRARRNVGPAIAVAGLFAAGAVAAAMAAGALSPTGTSASAAGPRRTFCIPDAGCSYVADDFALLLQALLALSAAVVVLMAQPAVREQRLPTGEFHFLLLSSVTGMLLLPASRDLLMLLLALEVVSIPGFVLAGLRRTDPRSSESALKFFLVSVLSVAVMLYGMSLVYGLTGTLELTGIAAALEQPGTRLPLTGAAVTLVLVGFAFKISAVPFHFWAPDTYAGAPLPIAAFLSTASKAAGFAGLLTVLFIAFRPYADVWGPVLAVLAVASMTLGNLVALRQQSVVRLLAWSSVAQAGYMLVPLGAITDATSDPEMDAALAATLAYLGIYAAMNLGAFACVVAVGRRRPRNALEDYRGLARTSPLLAVVLALFLAALAGLPPGLAGLFAKVVVFNAAVDAGAGWLAVIMALNTVIALFYYLRLAAVLFLGRDEAAGVPAAPDGRTSAWPALPTALTGAIAVTAAVTVVLSVAPQLLLQLAPLATLAR